MSPPRSQIVDPFSVQILHVFNRCVRRSFLCGFDAVSGKDYSHRKDWIRRRLEFLTGIFAFDIATYAIMGNHFHMVVRSRPDIVASWSDEEVAIRDMKLQGKVWYRKDGTPRKSAPAEIQRIVNDPDELQRLRRKLSNVSSLMAYFDRHIAYKANREDELTGFFWEGTFGASLIEDENSLLACMAYVDLNPIRAMMAETLEESDDTGAFERIHELRRDMATGQLLLDENPKSEGEEPVGKALGQARTLEWERGNHRSIGWLAPIELDERRPGPDRDERGRRPSRKGFLPISLLKYLEIVEWMGRQIRPGKRGHIPEEVPPIFERLGFSSQSFLESFFKFVENDRYFRSTEREGDPARSFAVAQSA